MEKAPWIMHLILNHISSMVGSKVETRIEGLVDPRYRSVCISLQCQVYLEGEDHMDLRTESSVLLSLLSSIRACE